MKDGPVLCIEVEQECGDDILIGTILYPLGPHWGIELGLDHKLTLELRPKGGR